MPRPPSRRAVFYFARPSKIEGKEGAASGAPTSLHSLKHYPTRPARWLRRTRHFLSQTRADLGLAGGTPPVWLRDNPFLAKAGRTETRRLGLLLRLGLTVLLLAGLLLGGLGLERTYGQAVTRIVGFLFGMTFPAALFAVLTFIHATVVAGVRNAQATSLADEARRGTLPDLLLTPLRRAEMLLAMGAAPARTALLVALAGLPVYVLLGEFGALTAGDIFFLYLLFALLSYAPPLYALPALAGGAMTPETALGKFGLSQSRRPVRTAGFGSTGGYIIFSIFSAGPLLGMMRGGWLGHGLAALHLHLNPSFSLFLFLGWPVYAVQVLSARLDFFHGTVSPLVYALPLLAARWVASALQSAAALSAGDADDMARLPLASRARTVARWTARAAGLCALAILWRGCVEGGDTAALAGGPFGVPGWDAAGLLLLLGGIALPAVCARALETPPGRKDSALRPALLVLRRAFRRCARPLALAGGMFGLACLLGGLSPFAMPVYSVAGELALTAAATVLWGVGVRRVLPSGGRVARNVLLYLLPAAALAAPVPGASWLSALSPATAWLRLFPDAAGMLSRFPLYHIAAPPSFAVCLAGSALVGAVGMAGRLVPAAAPQGRAPLLTRPSSPVRAASEASAPRHAARTASLLAWVTARTDNPLFTHEVRTRTRSGRWLDWLVGGQLLLLAAMVAGLAYPDFLEAMAATSPLHFFGSGVVNPGATTGQYGIARVCLNLAALLLAGQCYALGFRGQIIGEGLIARDRQRGIWGFLLLTPLTAPQIFWGKVWGQSSPAGALWAGCGLGGLLLYALTIPAVGPVPALCAWLVGQAFVASLFVLGLAFGAALSSYPVFFKNLRGMAALLFTAAVGLAVWAQFEWLPFSLPAWGSASGWSLLSARLLLGIGYAALLSVPLLVFAERRVAEVRRKDVAAGDGAG